MAKPYSPQEDCIIKKAVLSALANGRTATSGFQAAVKKLRGRTVGGVQTRFYNALVHGLSKKDRDLVQKAAATARRIRVDNGGRLDSGAIQKEAAHTAQDPFRILGAAGSPAGVRAAWKAASSVPDDSGRQWARAEVCARAHENGVTVKKIAEAIGISISQVKQLAKTYRTFPNPEDRFPVSFYHHRIVAGHSSANGLLRAAAENGWSTRELEAWVKTAHKPGRTVRTRESVIERLHTRNRELENHLRDAELQQAVSQAEIERLREWLRASRKLNDSLVKQLAAANRHRFRKAGEAKTGNPLEVRLTEGQKIVAGLGACAVTAGREGVRKIPGAFDVLMRLDFACGRIRNSVPAALADPKNAGRRLTRVREMMALLDACVTWVEKTASAKTAAKAV